MNIPQLMEITQASTEDVIKLLEGTEKQRQELERDNARLRDALIACRQWAAAGMSSSDPLAELCDIGTTANDALANIKAETRRAGE